MESFMNYRVRGLDGSRFDFLYGLSDEDLARHGTRRYAVDRSPGFPDRIEMRDASPGETALLLNFVHQPATNPYQSRHAIFVREGAFTPYDGLNTVPEVMRIRPISLRAFDADHEMVAADLVDGEHLEGLIERFLAHDDVAYLHAHYAKRGCYAATIERA